MDADEDAGKLLFDAGQRILDQELPVAAVHGDVFLIGAQEHHLADRHQLDATALAGAEEAPRLGVQLIEHGPSLTHGVAGLRQRRRKASGTHRFQQVVDGVDFESLQREGVVRGDEDDGRRSLQQLRVARELQPAHARHVDIDQHDVRRQPRQGIQRLQPVARFADQVVRHLGTAVAQQLLQTFARQGLVVHDEHARRGMLSPVRIDHRSVL